MTATLETPLIHKRINKKAVNVDSIEAMTKETDKMVTGEFLHVEYPGQSKRIACRYYKGQEYFNKEMMDGETYTIPLSVARHINERCFREVHGSLLDQNGMPTKSAKRTMLCKFIIGG